MKKSFCDKCGKDCTVYEREIICCGNHYLWVDNRDGIEVGKNLLLCLDCKIDFEKIIFDFVINKIVEINNKIFEVKKYE